MPTTRRAVALRYAAGITLVQAGWALRLVLSETGALPPSAQLPFFAGLDVLELAVPRWAERTRPTNWHRHHIAERYGQARTDLINRIHKLLLELLPGGAKKFLSAPQARTLLTTIRPRDLVGRTRRRLASELITDLTQIDKKIKAANKELTELVEATGSGLQDLNGIGPSGAARLIGDVGDVGDISRFATRGHFASWNGTAPLDASSGDQQRHRLSRAGNRRINRVLHIMAVVQLRHDTEGRAYYRRKLAAGKTPMEAMRCLKRRLSDVVYKRMINDAKEARTGPGGHVGATLQSSAADPIPMISTSEQSLPEPAETQPRTPLLAAS